jgi:hypothetical protein
VPATALVGWREWVSLPSLGVRAMKAKVDTGARTSALHASDVERARRMGCDLVRFSLHPLHHRPGVQVRCEAPLVDARRVTPSSGRGQERLVIAVLLELGGLSCEVEMTLADRQDMGFRMLLGREALKALSLVVHPSCSYLLGKRPRGLRRRPS